VVFVSPIRRRSISPHEEIYFSEARVPHYHLTGCAGRAG
jgi:hypothetical protein